MVGEIFTNHVHVDASFQGTCCYLQFVAYSMIGHLHYTCVVCNHKSLEAPSLAKHLIEQIFVGGGRNALKFIKRCHEASCTLLGCSLIGQHKLVHSLLAAHIYSVVVAAGLTCAIQGIVFHAGHDVVRGIQKVVCLISTHPSLCNLATQIWILTGTFGNAPPAGIVAYIHHW